MYNVFCCLLFIFYTIISLLYAFNIQKLLHKIKYTLKICNKYAVLGKLRSIMLVVNISSVMLLSLKYAFVQEHLHRMLVVCCMRENRCLTLKK